MDEFDKLYIDIAERKIKYLEKDYLPAIKSAGCDLELLLKNVEWAKHSLDGLLREAFSIRDKSLSKKYEEKYDSLVDKFNDLILNAVTSCECKKVVK